MATLILLPTLLHTIPTVTNNKEINIHDTIIENEIKNHVYIYIYIYIYIHMHVYNLLDRQAPARRSASVVSYAACWGVESAKVAARQMIAVLITFTNSKKHSLECRPGAYRLSMRKKKHPVRTYHMFTYT